MEEALRLKPTVTIDKFDSAIKENTYIIVNENRQWTISQLIYDIILLLDGNHTIDEILAKLQQQYGNRLSETNLQYIINEMFIKNGLICGYEIDPSKANSNKNKNLWAKKSIIHSKVINRIRIFTALFHPKYFKGLFMMFFLLQIGIVIYLLLNINLFSLNIYSTMGFHDYVGMVILIFSATFLHELGHASATMANGLISGDIGIGIYFIMPVLYTDVSQIWKLDKKDRVKVDIGGLYFNMIFNVLLFIIFLVFRDIRFLFILFLFTGQILMTLNPFLKMDGYWCFADIIGIPNLHKVAKNNTLNIVRRLFRRKPKGEVYNFGEREKKYINIYSFLTMFYYIGFYGWLASMSFKALSNISYLINQIINVFVTDVSITDQVLMLGKVISNDLLYYIVIVLLIRYAMVGIFKFKKFIIRRRGVYE